MGISLEEVLKRIASLKETIEYLATCKSHELTANQSVELQAAITSLDVLARKIDIGMVD